MNINEACLLQFLINPDEIHDLVNIFMLNTEIVEKNKELNDN